jgi:hypothetical protein
MGQVNDPARDAVIRAQECDAMASHIPTQEERDAMARYGLTLMQAVEWFGLMANPCPWPTGLYAYVSRFLDQKKGNTMEAALAKWVTTEPSERFLNFGSDLGENQ